MVSEPRPGQPSPEALVREQVDRILGDRLFQRSDRLSRFLRYVVEQSLSGRAAGLKEQVMAAELYARGDGFDPATDPIVRVDARRLRDKLREYYAELPNEPVLITLPKGSYAPKYEWNTSVASPDQASRSEVAGTETRRGGRRRACLALKKSTQCQPSRSTRTAPAAGIRGRAVGVRSCSRAIIQKRSRARKP